MKKTRQFDDIKNGELIRFLVKPSSSPYEKEVKALEKEAKSLSEKQREGEIIMFPEYPLPED